MNSLESDRQLAFLLLLSIPMHLDVLFDYYSLILLAFSLAFGILISYISACPKRGLSQQVPSLCQENVPIVVVN
jgi:hypothetical protein